MLQDHLLLYCLTVLFGNDCLGSLYAPGSLIIILFDCTIW